MSYGGIYYLISISDSIRDVLVGVNMVAGTGVFVLLSVWGSSHDRISWDGSRKEELKELNRRWRLRIGLLTLLFGCSVATYSLIPSKKDAIIIAGLSYGSDTIDSTLEPLGKLPPKLLKLINQELDEALGETK